jgi:hypothetical protein
MRSFLAAVSILLFAAMLVAQTPTQNKDKDVQWPKIASVSVSKPLPDGNLSIARIGSDDYFIVKRADKDLPEIVERIDCSKAKVMACPNGALGGTPDCGYDDTPIYHGKGKGWSAACPKDGKEAEMVFFAGGDPDFKSTKENK